MASPNIHPSNDQLSAFGAGKLLRHDAEVIETHITECRQCCDTLLAISSDDTFTGLLHEVGTEREPADKRIPESLKTHNCYEILEHVGRGGMGDVYKARHRMMDRVVALKVINNRFVGNADATDRFHREVKATAQLSHPNIVASHDAEQADSLHFLVMEHVAGVNLAELVQERGPLPLKEACEYAYQAALGLQYTHQQGMVHRDMKPHNLMLSDSGTIKILDFGLATLSPVPVGKTTDPTNHSSSLTMADSILGTHDYIAPEQANDAASADWRSDIYSLGTTLYFLLAGRAPFDRGSVAQKLKDHRESPIERIDVIRPDVPHAFAEVIHRMLAKNPAARYQSAADVTQALAPFFADTPTTMKPKVRSNQRSRMRSVLVGLALASCILFAGLIYVVTDNGTLVIESSDANVEIVVRQGGDRR